jgi:hypothetical protein
MARPYLDLVANQRTTAGNVNQENQQIYAITSFSPAITTDHT